MPPIAIPNTLRASVRMARGDEEIVNVLHLQKPPGYDATVAAAIQNVVLSFYENTTVETQKGIRQHIANDIVIGECTVTDISALPFGIPYTRIDSVAGGASADILPLQTALVVTLRTATGGRSGRGRLFLGGFTEAANDEASTYPRPSATLLTDVNNAMTSLRAALTTLGPDLCVASPATGVHHLVTAHQIKNVWRTQRRRAASVGATSIVSG